MRIEPVGGKDGEIERGLVGKIPEKSLRTTMKRALVIRGEKVQRA